MTRIETLNVAPRSFLLASDIRPFPFMLHLCAILFPIKCNRRYMPYKSALQIEGDVKNAFLNGTIAILALGLRPSHVRSIPIPSFAVSARTSPLVGSAPGMFSKSRLQFTRQLIEFRTRSVMRIPFFRCAECIIQPSCRFNPFGPRYYHILKETSLCQYKVSICVH